MAAPDVVAALGSKAPWPNSRGSRAPWSNSRGGTTPWWCTSKGGGAGRCLRARACCRRRRMAAAARWPARCAANPGEQHAGHGAPGHEHPDGVPEPDRQAQAGREQGHDRHMRREHAEPVQVLGLGAALRRGLERDPLAAQHADEGHEVDRNRGDRHQPPGPQHAALDGRKKMCLDPLPGEVPHPQLRAQLACRRVVALVEQPGVVRVVGPDDADERPPQHLDRLAARHERGDERHPQARRRRRRRPVRQSPNVTKGAREPPAAWLELGGILAPARRQVADLSWEDWTI